MVNLRACLIILKCTFLGKEDFIASQNNGETFSYRTIAAKG